MEDRSGVLFEDAEDNGPQSSIADRRTQFNSVDVFPVNKPPTRRKREAIVPTQSKRTATCVKSASGSASVLESASTATTGMASNPCQIEAQTGTRGSDLLDDRNVADVDELYGENERALSNFIRLHPMLRYFGLKNASNPNACM